MAARFLFSLRTLPLRLRQSLKVSLSGVSDVLPKRFPLVFLVPNVGALKRWDDVTDVFLEKLKPAVLLVWPLGPPQAFHIVKGGVWI